jgi:AraC-like DNA-binding protein/ligand-binding sensor protein
MQTVPPVTGPLPRVSAAAPARNNQPMVAQLEKSALFRDYRQAFEASTGLPLGMRASGSFRPPLQRSKLINPFCALMAGTNKTCAACLNLQQRIEQEAAHESKTLECFAGLSESAVPVRVGETTVGYLQTGQVLLRKPSKSGFAAILSRLEGWDSTIDRQALKKAYFGSRVLARRHYESMVRLLSIFGQHLSAISNQVMVRETQAEVPAIAKARAYIAEHKTEEISLIDVARAVNLSEFYFCKIFKKETGLTFLDYLSRVRIESVKERLLNPHKRVSEAAYEAGFQSLSQFNRVFRRIAGEAPSTYRERLHPAHSGSPGSSFAHAA